MTTAEITTMHEEIRELATERGAVILAHNYQVPEVQGVADYVGDSLGLSREAAATDAEAIVFCGVHFMAETARSEPQKTVLIPDLDAGCSLAASISADQLRAGKRRIPARSSSPSEHDRRGKAESDYCCTSGNAKGVIESIPEGTEILFLRHVPRALAREGHRPEAAIWMGECHVHAGIRPQEHHARQARRAGRGVPRAPRVRRLREPVHGIRQREHAHPLHGRDDQLAKSSPKERFLVATETGISHGSTRRRRRRSDSRQSPRRRSAAK